MTRSVSACISLHLVGAEALVRARHPTRGIVSPDMFLPGAGEDARKAPCLKRVTAILRDHSGRAVNSKALTANLLFIGLPEWRKLSPSPPIYGRKSVLLTQPLFRCAPGRDDLIRGAAGQLCHVVELEDERTNAGSG
jgi:hypothetical protein